MREWVLIATRRAEMSLRTPDVVEFCHEPRPQGAVGVTPNWLKSISPPPHNCGDDTRSFGVLTRRAEKRHVTPARVCVPASVPTGSSAP